jgi:threonylcarbamoyladenosine tRNA methylthiotransferase MtaB
MKRRHLRDHVIQLCDRLRRERPEIVFGADLIAGFPTETDAMFENSRRLVDEAGLVYLHVFPFSPHPETPAARMPQVDRRVIKMRATQLRQLGQDQLRRYLATQMLKPQRVLVEHQQGGHTETFAPVRWDKSLSFPAGHIVELCPQSVHDDALWVQHEHADEL